MKKIMTILGPVRAHNPNGTGDRRVFLYFTMGAPFPNAATSHGGSRPNLTHDFLDPFEPTTQTASRSV